MAANGKSEASRQALHLTASEQLLAMQAATAALRQLTRAPTNAILLHTLMLRSTTVHLTAPEELLTLHVAAATRSQLPRAAANTVFLHALRL